MTEVTQHFDVHKGHMLFKRSMFCEWTRNVFWTTFKCHVWTFLYYPYIAQAWENVCRLPRDKQDPNANTNGKQQETDCTVTLINHRSYLYIVTTSNPSTTSPKHHLQYFITYMVQQWYLGQNTLEGFLLSLSASPAAAPKTETTGRKGEKKQALKRFSGIINHFDKQSQI